MSIEIRYDKPLTEAEEIVCLRAQAIIGTKALMALARQGVPIDKIIKSIEQEEAELIVGVEFEDRHLGDIDSSFEGWFAYGRLDAIIGQASKRITNQLKDLER